MIIGNLFLITYSFSNGLPPRTAGHASPVPVSNVFKWQFENTAIFNFQLSILNSPRRAGNGGRSVSAPTARGWGRA